MRIYNRFLVCLLVTLSLMNVVMAFLGQDDLAIYFTLNAIVFLIITLYFRLNPRALSFLRALGFFLFFGFVVAIVFKIILML